MKDILMSSYWLNDELVGESPTREANFMIAGWARIGTGAGS